MLVGAGGPATRWWARGSLGRRDGTRSRDDVGELADGRDSRARQSARGPLLTKLKLNESCPPCLRPASIERLRLPRKPRQGVRALFSHHPSDLTAADKGRRRQHVAAARRQRVSGHPLAALHLGQQLHDSDQQDLQRAAHSGLHPPDHHHWRLLPASALPHEAGRLFPEEAARSRLAIRRRRRCSYGRHADRERSARPQIAAQNRDTRRGQRQRGRRGQR